MAGGFEVRGKNSEARFSLKIHRGDGMALLAMNWRGKKPPRSFVGFAIEYREPGGDRFFALKNRLGFAGPEGAVDPNRLSTLRSPIQKFRWVHFPRNAEIPGEFVYRVTPVFLNEQDELSYGEAQTAPIELRRETFPGKLNVAYTRGFVSSQAFVERYESAGAISKLLPARAKDGLKFVPTHKKAAEALAWMGFEGRSAILEILDEAIADTKAEVRVVAYDLSERDVVSRLEKLGARLRIIVDDSAEHHEEGSGESQAAERLRASGAAVKRQHMGQLQHNKTIVVEGPKVKAVVCGSTNFTWRGFFVQSNNAVVLRGASPAAVFRAAFEDYWTNETAEKFGGCPSAEWIDLGLKGIDAEVTFSPHAKKNARLQEVGKDIEGAKSSLLYSLAFLAQTPGIVRDAIKKLSNDEKIFVYGIADKEVGGLDLLTPGGNVAPVFPAALGGKDVPEPFRSEPTGGGGVRMHHKFLVVDFDKPTARVYLGSYNFSVTADSKNGENLLVIRDRRIAVSYMIEAIRTFDHYHFRVKQLEAKKGKTKLQLRKPPRKAGETAWWDEYYTDPRKARDRKLFA